MTTDQWIALADDHIMKTYNRYPVVIGRGKGTRLWDTEGKSYLDFVAGIAVCNLGHCHPRVVDAIKKQAEKLIHVSNLFYIETQIRYAELLVKYSFADKVFFCNSGAEANEGAIKLARLYTHQNMGEGKTELISMQNSFHGRTLTALAATGQEKYKNGFQPLPEGFVHVPYNDLKALSNAVNDKTYAVMIEPIQGEGGIVIPAEDYLKQVRQLCDERGILLILDEVQVGMGRTGKFFAYEHEGIIPDIVTLAKAMGNGFPMGAVLAKGKVASAFAPGTHASTFGGNPLAMAAGLAMLETLIDEEILENCVSVGAYLMDGLNRLKQKYSIVKDVRGKGLIVGMELQTEGGDIVNKCMKKGVLINCTNGNVLRFVPPLIVTKADVDELLHILDEVMVTL